MASVRSLVLTAFSCAALAAPVIASADAQPATSPAVQPQPNAACDCAANCAQQQRTAAAVRRHHRRAAAPATVATMHIDSRVSRNVADGCHYTATATGQYRGALLSNAPDGKIRDVHVAADNALSCNGRVVRHQTHRWDLAQTTRRELTQAMHDRLAIQVPGSSCSFASTYGFQGGNLQARSADSSCARAEETTALQNYRNPAATNVTPRAVGGGPTEPTSFDARVGTH